MKRFNSLGNRAIAFALSILIVLGMLPASVFAMDPSELTTDIGEKNFVVGEAMEFTFTTTANGDAGVNVLGAFVFSDPDAVEKLEYQDSQSGSWYAFYGDFGPTGGFPMTDATSHFRVTFNKAGTYTVNAAMVKADDREELCSVTETVTVERTNPSVLTTNIGDTVFTVGQTSEFTFTTTANGDAGVTVLGTFEFSDPDAVEKLEYLEAQSGNWYAFYGDFGPAGGFPMTDATSHFRVTFNKVGSYTVKASMVRADNREVLCSVTKTVTVERANPGTLTTTIGDAAFTVGQMAEFTFTTTANADAGTYVLGTFEFSDPDAVEKLEYQDSQSGSWYAFYGDFGPAEGFPMTDATSYFRVTFKKAGNYTVKASIVTAADRTVLCSVTKNVAVNKVDSTLSTTMGDSFVVGQTTEFTFTTTANGDAGVTVLGTFVFSDPDAVEKLEYQDSQSGSWYAFYGDFGPAGGFPMTDATSHFRVTFKKAGNYTLTVAMKNVADGSVMCSLEKNIQVVTTTLESFCFANTNPTITYAPNQTYSAELVGLDDSVTFAIKDGADVADIDPATGVLTIKKAGTVTVVATRPADSVYSEATAEYTLTVNKAKQDNFGFGDPTSATVTYLDNGNLYTVKAEGGQPDCGVTYAITSGDAATVDENGVVTIVKAGTVEITATKAGNECYEAAAATFTLTINKAAQSDFGFGDPTSATVTYLDNGNQYTVKAEGGQSTGGVTYAITSGDAATVDENGVVTIGKAGTVEITATKAGDECYEAATATFTLTIEKAQRVLSIANDDLTYGQDTYYDTVIPADIPYSGTVSYAVEAQNIEATVDKANGRVTLGNLSGNEGTVTVTVTLPEDDRYLETVGTYTITVRCANAPEAGYILEQIPDSGWFNRDVTVTAASGWQISTNNALNANWQDSLVWGEETNGSAVVYLRNVQTGAITAAISVPELKLDKTAPADIAINCDVSAWTKILEALFGYKNSDVKVTLEASDKLSGIAKVEYSTDGEEYTEITADETGKYEFEITAQYRGQLSVRVTDAAGNETVYKHVGELDSEEFAKILVVDNTDMKMTVSYTSDGAIEKAENGIVYSTGNKVTLEVKFSDENLDLFAADPVVKVNGNVVDGWVAGENTNTLTFSLTEEGDYDISVAYRNLIEGKDVSQNLVVRIDRTAPVITTNIEENKDYTEDLNFVLTITEHNFDASKVDLQVLADNEAVSNFAASGQWSHEGDVHTLTVPVPKDAYYEIAVNYTDDLGLAAEAYSTSFTLDRIAPTEPVLEYTTEDGVPLESVKIGDKTYLFASGTVRVTVKTGDATSGVTTVDYDLDGIGGSVLVDADGSCSFDLKEECRAQLNVTVTDRAGNQTSKTDDRILVIDDSASYVTVSYSGGVSNGSATHMYHDGAFTVDIVVREDNFFVDADTMDIQISYNGEIVKDWTAAGITDSGWKFDEDTECYVKVLKMTRDGDYKIVVEYQDYSGNKMNWSSSNETFENSENNLPGVYESKIHTIDTIAPRYEVTFGNDSPYQTLNNLPYYQKTRTAKITVTERNFDPESMILSIKGVDVAGNPVAEPQAVWTQAGDVWTATVSFAADAKYTMNFSYTDPANHAIADYSTSFVVDTAKPDVQVDYKSKSAEWLNTILGAITFGHHNAAQEVVLTMNDATAGIEYIKLTVTAEGPAGATKLTMPKNLVLRPDGSVKSGEKGFIGDIRVSQTGGKLTMSFDVPKEFRGKVNFVAYDKSGNSASTNNDNVLVVDTVSPECSVTYNPSNEASGVMYFSSTAEADIVITEANFDPSQVKIQVLDTNGNAVQGWTLSNWETNGNEHTAKVRIAQDGDYQVKIEYTDYSENAAKTYTSGKIVVDKIAPAINVEYTNKAVRNHFDGRDYFSGNQTAIITITERNFRGENVDIIVEAVDVTGKSVNYQVKANWQQKDDIWTAEVPFNVDANYTFDIVCTDLAGNKAADYAKDLFTVDKMAPDGLTITYKTDVAEQILEALTFGYYNAKVTVTITAEDNISGIYRFAYSYKNAENVSAVNAQLLNEAINEAQIRYSNDGKTATASFSIPKDVLGPDNQFNGNVEFTAYNRSELSKEKIGDNIVVDNIRPTAQITYNAPIKNVNGVSYYAGNIHATLKITEANFDSQDVHVTATKDGAAYPVNVVWDEEKVEGDTHTATFVLTNEGDYIITIRYRDKSLNDMATYVSGQLTLDTTSPTIKVSDIKANSANKDEKYGFVITFDDINLDAAAMKPVLKAVKRSEGDVYEVTEIDLGNPVAVVNNRTYTYTVEDLPEDGMYTLICEVADMSGNTMNQVVLDDNKTYNEVQFSINREGSVFGYGNKFSEELVNQYFIYSVDEDIMIVEVNVDPVETYKVMLNGTELVEGTDYTTEQTTNAGEWSKRTYTIKKELFEAEGEYSVIVTSTDKTETTAYSDIKNLSLSFVVDQTKPTVTISGLETGGRYQTTEQTVTLIPTDEGGRLKSLTVIILDVDGQPLTDAAGNDISVRFDMAGEDLLKHLEENDGKVTFTIPEGFNNQVRIVCNDCAVNAEYLTNEYNQTFGRVTVSPNQFVIFYANTPLFIGSIVGALGLVAAIIVMIKRKKTKAKV